MNSDKVKILVVDDLDENRLVLHTILEELGEEVVTAASGQEALRQVLEHEFAVILLDVNMPDIDGYETASLIRRRRKSSHTPIIFVTAYADEMHKVQGYSIGAVDFILAPVVPEILRTKVKVFIDLFRMTEQVRRQADEQVMLAREQVARMVAEESVRRLDFLAEASKVLANTLDFDATLRALLRFLVPRLADLGAITLIDDQGRLSLTEIAWSGNVHDQQAQTLRGASELHDDLNRMLQHVLAHGKAAYLPQLSGQAHATELLRALTRIGVADGAEAPRPRFDPRSVAMLPLVARGRVLGILTLCTGATEHAPERPFSLADRALAEDLASRAAIAMDNARLYRNIQDADRSKNEFISMLAHELRNPLAPILNGVQLLGLPGRAHPEAAEIRSMIERQVQHLVRLVDDLLDVSRITRGKIQLQTAPIEISAIVSRAVEVSRSVLEARRHELIVSVPEQPILVEGDPVRLAQVLTNLLNNAAKYTEERGKVWLTVERDGSEVAFKVKDNGIGIPPEMLSSIFELFTQVSNSSDRSQGGLGIGLTLVRRLVEMHGGTVHAHSAGPNQGSEFVVRLPVAAHVKPPAPASSLPEQRPASSRQRVLVVDDNVDVARGLAMLLRELGQEVHVVHDGPDALAAAEAFRPEFVLLDIGLPGMDGYEVAWKLRQQSGPGKPLLVALTGYGQEDDRRRSKDAGFDHHFVKPVRLGQLTALFAGALQVETRM